jgi:sec-independent protein translocase protein TatB
MFDIGWSEMGVIALVTLVVMGPKELPNALRTFAYWMKKVRGMAREFQSGVDQIIREAELDEAKKKLQAASTNLNREIEKAIDPERQLEKAITPPTELKAPATKIEAKPAEPKPPESVEATSATPPSAEVKPFPVPGVPLTGSAAVAASSLRPNGNGAAPADSGVAIGAAKPAPAAPINGGGEGEEAPARKAQSG